MTTTQQLLRRSKRNVQPYFVRGVSGAKHAPMWTLHSCAPSSTVNLTGQPFSGVRNPLLLTCNDGSIMAFAKVFEGGIQDYNGCGIIFSKSTDGGKTWTVPAQAYLKSNYSADRKHWLDEVSVGQSAGGRIFLFWIEFDSTDGTTNTCTSSVQYCKSDDGGTTWSANVDITATTKKVDNTHPTSEATILASTYAKTNAIWGWMGTGPGTAVTLKLGALAGRMIVPGTHRYIFANTFGDFDTSTNSYNHTMICDNPDAVTPAFHLGGGLIESTAGNLDANECCMVECANGDLYANFRNRGNGVTTRYSSRSTDQGLTWATHAAESVQAASAEASAMCKLANGNIVLLSNNDTALRSKGSIFLSADNGLTWTLKKTVWETIFGYCAICCPGGQNMLAMFECVENTQASGGPISDGFASFQMIHLRGFNLLWVNSTQPTQAGYIQHWFNEATSGAVIQTQDHGTGGYPAFGAGSAKPSYGANGITFAGDTTTKLILQPAQTTTLGGPWDMRTDSCTIELQGVKFTFTPGVEFNAFVDLGQSPNCLIRLNASENAHAGVDWEVNAKIVSTGDILSGTLYDIVCVRDNAAGKYSIYKALAGTGNYVLGSQDTASAATNFHSNLDHTMGYSATDASGQVATIQGIRFTRAALAPSQFTPCPASPETPAQLYGYTPPALTTNPAALSGTLKLWMYKTSDGGQLCSVEGYTGSSPPPLPAPRGMGICSYRDPIYGGLYTNGTSRGAWWDSDATVGIHVRQSYVSAGSAGGPMVESVLSKQIDHIQNIGTFAISFAVNFHTDTTENILDTSGAGGHPGIRIWREGASGLLSIRIWKDAADNKVFEQTSIGGTALAINTWYRVTICGNGSGNTLAIYITTLADQVLRTNGPINTSATFGTAGTYNSTNVITIGDKSDNTAPCDARWKNFLVYSGAPLTQQNHVDLAVFDTQH